MRPLLSALFDILFVGRCCVCERLGPGALCPECIDRFQTPRSPLCSQCGGQFQSADDFDRLCGRCRTDPPLFDLARAAFLYDETIAIPIKRLKYSRKTELAGVLGSLLAEAAAELPGAGDYCAVAPVPLHPRRLRERGFNQAAILARPVAKALGVACDCDYLRRVKDTPSQTGLSPAGRKLNVLGAFDVRGTGKPYAGKSILLIDDVLTTGATAAECAKALKRKGGAAVVDALALARAD